MKTGEGKHKLTYVSCLFNQFEILTRYAKCLFFNNKKAQHSYVPLSERVLTSWTFHFPSTVFVYKLLWLLWSYSCSDLVYCADRKVSAVCELPLKFIWAFIFKKMALTSTHDPHFSLHSHIPADAHSVQRECLHGELEVKNDIWYYFLRLWHMINNFYTHA